MFDRNKTIGTARLWYLRRLVFGICLTIAFSLLARPCVAQFEYDPEHPEVQKMISRGLDFIMDNQSNLIGYRVMQAMAAYKANIYTSATPKDHPLIDAAIEQIYKKCTEVGLQNSMDFEKMYASALACVFLLELDPQKHQEQIQILLDHIVERQQSGGAWGYRSETPRNVGDTSQMQYIALALWLANEHGFEVKPEVAKRGLQWMVDTQLDNGGWIYKVGGGLVAGQRADDQVRHSLVAAGLGTTYLYGDLLRLRRRPANAKINTIKVEDLDLPPSVMDITNEKDQQTTATDRKALVSFDSGTLGQTISKGNNWFRKNFKPNPGPYGMYYLYGFERYASLREYVEGSVAGIEDWYDQGVKYLMSIQTSAGNFPGESGDVGESCKTAFGILFLTRSMQITISDRARSRLRGNEGFPNDAILHERGGVIVSQNMERTVSAFLALMEDPDNDELKNLDESFDKLVLDGDKASRSQQLATMRMLVGHKKYEVRRAAIKFLSNQRSLDNVPALLFALTDPDPRIAQEANRGLKFVSRKTDEFDLSANPNKAEIKNRKEQWIQWYRHVRPGATLLNEPDDGDND